MRLIEKIRTYLIACDAKGTRRKVTFEPRDEDEFGEAYSDALSEKEEELEEEEEEEEEEIEEDADTNPKNTSKPVKHIGYEYGHDCGIF